MADRPEVGRTFMMAPEVIHAIHLSALRVMSQDQPDYAVPFEQARATDEGITPAQLIEYLQFAMSGEIARIRAELRGRTKEDPRADILSPELDLIPSLLRGLSGLNIPREALATASQAHDPLDGNVRKIVSLFRIVRDDVVEGLGERALAARLEEDWDRFDAIYRRIDTLQAMTGVEVFEDLTSDDGYALPTTTDLVTFARAALARPEVTQVSFTQP